MPIVEEKREEEEEMLKKDPSFDVGQEDPSFILTEKELKIIDFMKLLYLEK